MKCLNSTPGSIWGSWTGHCHNFTGNKDEPADFPYYTHFTCIDCSYDFTVGYINRNREMFITCHKCREGHDWTPINEKQHIIKGKNYVNPYTKPLKNTLP